VVASGTGGTPCAPRRSPAPPATAPANGWGCSTSDGERRYHGSIEVFGSRIGRIDMDAYRVPDSAGGTVTTTPADDRPRPDNVTRIH